MTVNKDNPFTILGICLFLLAIPLCALSPFGIVLFFIGGILICARKSEEEKSKPKRDPYYSPSYSSSYSSGSNIPSRKTFPNQFNSSRAQQPPSSSYNSNIDLFCLSCGILLRAGNQCKNCGMY